ncbi:uncharacterized protein LOC144113652 isoform X3 [Amblyomma americanum]
MKCVQQSTRVAAKYRSVRDHLASLQYNHTHSQHHDSVPGIHRDAKDPAQDISEVHGHARLNMKDDSYIQDSIPGDILSSTRKISKTDIEYVSDEVSEWRELARLLPGFCEKKNLNKKETSWSVKVKQDLFATHRGSDH